MKTNINKIDRIRACILCLILLIGCMPTAVFAANAETATIDTSKTGSLTIYKYDMTNAEKDGVWETSSYVSTGLYDESVNGTLGDAARTTVNGNGETVYGYAVKGVKFGYAKIAEIVQYTEAGEVVVLYEMDRIAAADFLYALGLSEDDQFDFVADNAVIDESNCYYFESDTLIRALADSLQTNATTTKNAMERYLAAMDSNVMDETDACGKTSVDGLALGLYLIVETAVPENVTCTTNPFLVSLPMTNVTGSNAADGGSEWIYDVTVYPKNATGIPELTKEVRESAADGGHNEGSFTDITDGFSHVATASSGDTLEYQIITTLPTITSEVTCLTTLTWTDQLSKGMTYNDGVRIKIFTDKACTDEIIDSWVEDADFTVEIVVNADGSSTMYIVPTEAGYTRINTSDAVYDDASVLTGYSDLTVRITYSVILDADDSAVLGDDGNMNEVSLKWQRSNETYFDTLEDHTHVYTYGIDLTKEFSDAAGDFNEVEFLLHNDADGWYIIAEKNEDEGVYYVTGHTAEEAEATHLIPVTHGTVAESYGASTEAGKIIVMGLEDDTYTLTEVSTDSGYTMLKNAIVVVISAETSESCSIYGKQDILGVIQNDPRFQLNAIYSVASSKGYTVGVKAPDGNVYETREAAVDAWLATLTNIYDRTIKASTNDYCGLVELLDELGVFDSDNIQNKPTASQIAAAKADEASAEKLLLGLYTSNYEISEVLEMLDNAFDSLSVQTASAADNYNIIVGMLYDLGSLDNYWHNIPQQYLEHDLLTASATVDGNAVDLSADLAGDKSANAMAKLTVVNTKGFDLPETGETGMYLFGILGGFLMLCALAIVFAAIRKKAPKQNI